MAAAPTVLPSLAPARDIPQSFKESVAYWWHSGDKETAAAEERLLRRLPFFSSSAEAPADPSTSVATDSAISRVVARLSKVEIGNKKRFLNMFSITPTTAPLEPAKVPPPTVVLHGYGAGLGFFFMNFNALGEWAGRRGASIYALDWLGMGLSARVPFKVTAKREDYDGRVKEAENFFLDALEDWRIKQGFEKMNLVGHSLGGYLSTAYALRFPDRVNRLILLSPAGVPRDPHAVSKVADAAMEATEKVAQAQQSLVRRLGTHAWEAGWSPFQIIRSTLFWGPLLVGKYSSRRFAHLTDEDVRDLNDYIWHITRAKGSGEYSISHILAPGAHARLPLVDRISALKMPVAFVYGEDDWMDANGGAESVRRLREAGNKDSRNYIIPYAGHHLYLDNPEAVNNLLVRELEKTVPK